MICHKDSMEDMACIQHNKDKYIYLTIPMFITSYIITSYIIASHISKSFIWLGFVISPSTSVDPGVACVPFPNIVVHTKWYNFRC